jgi:hypothetical protein
MGAVIAAHATLFAGRRIVRGMARQRIGQILNLLPLTPQ